MANIDIDVAGRRYPVSCRDGEEAHLHAAAALVDQRARDAAGALGTMSESRTLLFAALLLADDVKEVQKGGAGPALAVPDVGLLAAIEALADRIEQVADRIEDRAALEDRGATP